jgi:3-oxoacyl-[acyl-carrier protein] reductase
MSLKGRVALVTGSGRNIGRAMVLELAREGADVVVNARSNREEAESVAREAREMGVRALAVVADVGDAAQVERMMGAAIEEFGRIDILINNAGLRRSTPFVEMTHREWREILAVNLDGPFYCCKAVAPGMIQRKWGRIINVGGQHAFRGGNEFSHVSAAKLGALGLTRSLAVELAPYGILVNHIVPGSFDTIREGGNRIQMTPQQLNAIPLHRQGQPEEAAKLCAFLASDGASYITGQTIHVNGGVVTY